MDSTNEDNLILTLKCISDSLDRIATSLEHQNRQLAILNDIYYKL